MQVTLTATQAQRIAGMAPDWPEADNMSDKLASATLWTLELRGGDLRRAEETAKALKCYVTRSLAAASAVRYLGMDT